MNDEFTSEKMGFIDGVWLVDRCWLVIDDLPMSGETFFAQHRKTPVAIKTSNLQDRSIYIVL